MVKYYCSHCGLEAYNDKFNNKPILKCSCAKQKVWVSDDNGGGRMKNIYSAKPVTKEELRPKEDVIVMFRRTKKKRED